MVVLLVVLGFSLPAFYYNHLEAEQRSHFLANQYFKEQTDELIAIRTGENDVFISDQEKLNLAGKIEELQEISSVSYDFYAEIFPKQDSIPFLPTKYKEYQELKKQAYET